MAYCQTTQWADSYSPSVKLTVTESASTATSSTLSWKLQYIAPSAASTSVAKSYTVKIAGSTVKTGTYSINGKTGTHDITSGTTSVTKTKSAQTITFSVSFAFNLTWSGTYSGTRTASGSISVPAITTYSIKYNANGGSGAPSSQSKWHGTNITLSSTKPTRTGYTFQGWATSASGAVAYASGATYSANAAVTLYAVWKAITYTVQYNANGGTGAPGNQTKTYGQTLTLSSTKPTRANYTFKGWGTAASSTTVSYASGASYTKNAAVTLYAIWELSYVKPRISNLSITRSNSGGTTTVDGKYASVKFDWACDKTVASIKIEYKQTSATTWTSVTPSASGLSGSVNRVIGGNALSAEYTYDIRITVSDASGSSYATSNLPSMKFVVDYKAGGTGVAFGKAAELNDTAEFAFDVKFNGPVYGNVAGLSMLPKIPDNSDLNNYTNPGCWSIRAVSSAETIANMPPIVTSGRLEVFTSNGVELPSTGSAYVRQRYVTSRINNLTWERELLRDSSNAWTYTEWRPIWGSTAWKELTLASGFEVYGDTSPTPQYRVNNNTVTVIGAVKPTAAIPSGETAKIAGPIVSYYRPKYDMYYVCQGSGMYRWLLKVGADGNLYISRYGTTSDVGVGAGSWLVFTATYSL